MIIPVREFKNTKLRLSQILSESQRAALTESLLIHVIQALENAKHEVRITIVSSQPEEISQSLKSSKGVEVLLESTRHGGVNSAVDDALQDTSKFAEMDAKILVIPSDLPFLSSEAIDRAIELLDHRDLVINPSVKMDGTNLLAFHLNKRISFWYDNDSYTNHVKEAKSMKMDYIQIDWKEFSLDLDDPQDLDRLKNELNVDSVESLISVLRK